MSSWTDKRRRLKVFTKLTPVVGAATILSLGLSQAAEAVPACSNNDYYYSGYYTSSSSYAGVEGAISVDNIGVAYGLNESHEINYLAGSTANTGCVNSVNKRQCQIQSGYGVGYVGGAETTSVPEAYMEEEDINGYDASFYPPGAVGLTQNDYVSVFFAGTTETYTQLGGGTAGLWDAYLTPTGGSPILVGQAWLPNYKYAQVFSQSEAENFATPSPYACPYVEPTEYFGTNGGGGTNSNTVVNLVNPSTFDWEAWPSSDYVNHTDGSVFVMNPIITPSAFSTYKVGL